jgi:hypothetical protein
VDGGEGEEEEGVWETYMKISKRPPLQEIQLQHTYANIRQAVQSSSFRAYMLIRVV